MFYNRKDAGVRLADKLKKFRNDPGVILAIPRGGVPVAYEVARKLGFPLEVILTKKIGHPTNKEYAIGAASLTDYFAIPHEGLTEEYIKEALQIVRSRLKEMQLKFMGKRQPEDLRGKTVIIIDDGIATGNTLLVSVQIIRKAAPGKIIVAVPVASRNAIQKLSKVADEVITLLEPDEFYGVGAFYEDFQQVTDEEVVHYLEDMRMLKKKTEIDHSL